MNLFNFKKNENESEKESFKVPMAISLALSAISEDHVLKGISFITDQVDIMRKNFHEEHGSDPIIIVRIKPESKIQIEAYAMQDKLRLKKILFSGDKTELTKMVLEALDSMR